MGILVICSYRIKPGHEAAARKLLGEHVPALRKAELITDRPAVQGEGANGAVVEIFEWESEEKSRAAPTIPEIGAIWKAMGETMEFVPLASVEEAAKPFAHFRPAA